MVIRALGVSFITTPTPPEEAGVTSLVSDILKTTIREYYKLKLITTTITISLIHQ